MAWGNSVAPPPPPAASGSITAETLAELNRAATQEKTEWVNKTRTIQQDPAGKQKWWLFCKTHGEGNTDVYHHDEAFLMTFIEAYEAGTIIEVAEIEDNSRGWGGDASSGGDASKIFVGGLPKGTKEDALWHYFGKWGTVAKVDNKLDENGEPRGFAFVTFQDAAIAQQVLDNKDRNYMDGKWIDCKPADGGKGGSKGGKGGGGAPSGGSSEETKVFVGGLPKTATQDSVSNFFSYYGAIEKTDLKYDPEGNFRGFGFIIFSSAESAAKLLAKPSMEFEGKWIECKSPNAKGSGKGGKDQGKDQGKGGNDQGQGNSGWSGGGGGGWQDRGSSGGGGWQDRNDQSGGGGGGWKNNDQGSWKNNNDQGGGGGGWNSSGGGGGGGGWQQR